MEDTSVYQAEIQISTFFIILGEPRNISVIFISFHQQEETSKDSGRVLPLYVPQKPSSFPPALSACAAVPIGETASFCVRIAREDSAIATDVLGPTSLNYDAQRFSAAQC